MTSIDSIANFVASQDRRERPMVTGHWHNLQIKPDLGSSEVLNVGVAFVDQAQNVHLKLARDLSRLSCLYDGVTSILWTGLASMRSAGGKHHVFEEGSKPDSAGLSVH